MRSWMPVCGSHRLSCFVLMFDKGGDGQREYDLEQDDQDDDVRDRTDEAQDEGLQVCAVAG